MRLSRYTVALAIVPLFCVASAAASPSLLPHRAVYDLALAGTANEASIEGLTGRWVFDFGGSACEGYTVTSRIVMRFDMAEGPSTIDQRVQAFESADGRTFRFDTKSFIDQELDNEVKGSARLVDGQTVVRYEKPQEIEHSFGPTLFPTAQMKEILQRANAGENFYETAIFDGTEYVEKAMPVSVVVGKPEPVAESDPENPVLGSLRDDEFRPVTAAYFDGENTDGEETSDYNVSFKLHEGGVQRDMTIRYEDYSMTAKLVGLTMHDRDEDCPGNAVE